MIDASKKKNLTVHAHGNSRPYLIVPVSLLAAVQNVLDSHKIPYYVEENTVSVDDKPPVVFLNLGREVNPHEVQILLDSHP